MKDFHIGRGFDKEYLHLHLFHEHHNCSDEVMQSIKGKIAEHFGKFIGKRLVMWQRNADGSYHLQHFHPIKFVIRQNAVYFEGRENSEVHYYDLYESSDMVIKQFMLDKEKEFHNLTGELIELMES